MNEPKPYSAQNSAFPASTPKPTDPVAFHAAPTPFSSPAVANDKPGQSGSQAKPSTDASSDRKDGAQASSDKKDDAHASADKKDGNDASLEKKDGDDTSTEKKVSALIVEKAGVVAKKVTQVVGQTADRLSDGRDRLVSASRRSPQGAALTMLGVGIGTGIGCGILISSLYSKSRRKNRADSPLAD